MIFDAELPSSPSIYLKNLFHWLIDSKMISFSHLPSSSSYFQANGVPSLSWHQFAIFLQLKILTYEQPIHDPRPITIEFDLDGSCFLLMEPRKVMSVHTYLVSLNNYLLEWLFRGLFRVALEVRYVSLRFYLQTCLWMSLNTRTLHLIVRMIYICNKLNGFFLLNSIH